MLVPAYHHGVEIEALIDAGARPVFYRVGSRWEVDLADVARRITSQTSALYLIHFAGFPGPVREMKGLAEEHGLPLIEDCALSLLSQDGALKLGTVGDIGIFCLYKSLPTPNGGALVVNGAERLSLPSYPPPPVASAFSHTIAALLRNIELRGGAAGHWARVMVHSVGCGAVRAGRIERVAIGTTHFDRAHLEMGISPLTLKIAYGLDMAAIVDRRRRNYHCLLEGLRDLAVPHISDLPLGVCPLFYPLVVRNKPEILARLHAAGIGAVDFWRDAHPACDPAEFPDVTQLRRTIIELPCHQDLAPDTMTRLAHVVRRVLCEQSCTH